MPRLKLSRNSQQNKNPLNHKNIAGWLDVALHTITNWIFIGLLGILAPNGYYLLTELSSSPYKPKHPLWVIASAFTEGFIIAWIIAVPVLVFIKSRLAKIKEEEIAKIQEQSLIPGESTKPAPASNKLYVSAEIEEVYDAQRRIKSRRSTLHVKNIGNTDIVEHVVSLSMADSRGVKRKIFINKAPKNTTGPYIVLKKITGNGSFEEREGSDYRPQGWWFTAAYVFSASEVLKPNQPENFTAFTYEYTYHNSPIPDDHTAETLAFAPEATVENLVLRAKFCRGHSTSPTRVYPRLWAPVGVEELPGYTPRLPRTINQSKQTEVSFQWPETVKGYPGNTSYVYGLEWSWDSKQQKV